MVKATTTVTRMIITDDTPMSVSIEMKANATVLLNDVEAIRHHMHSAGPYILVAHAIELLLKAYSRGVVATKNIRKRENLSHNLEMALDVAVKDGLVLSDPRTEDIVKALSYAVEDAKLRYIFSFKDLPTASDCLQVGRALLNDISVLVKPETPSEIRARRKKEKEEAEKRKRRPRLP
jgi:hypothetical protein